MIDPKEHPMLLAEPSSNAQQQRERYSGSNLLSRFNGAQIKTSICIIQFVVILAGQQSLCLRSTKHLHYFWRRML